MKSEIKAEVLRLVEQLSDDATWEDLEYAIYVRQAVEDGIANLEAGRTLTSDGVRQRLGVKVPL